MRSASRFAPQESDHLQQSEVCGSCHTLYTHTRDAAGEVIGRLPEQMPYLEWRHSGYRYDRSCQSCHMPQLSEPAAITGVLGQARDEVNRHVFRGGNFFMLGMLNRNAAALGVAALPQDLTLAHQRTKDHLQSLAGEVAIERVEVVGQTLTADVAITNLAGHKLPTAYPSRRVWLRFTVRDRRGELVFESGALGADGSIAGNDNDRDPPEYERHYQEISSPDEVQIYEAIMADPEGTVTTGLIAAIRFVKDNRILPAGFEKSIADADIAVHGNAETDGDFVGAGDRMRYRVDLRRSAGPYQVSAELWYQPIAFRWAQNLLQQDAPEIDRFISYYGAMAPASAIILAETAVRAAPS